MRVLLPANLQTACDLLISKGLLTPEQLSIALRQAGIVMPAARLSKLPERYPQSFEFDGEGHLRVPRPRQEQVPQSFEHLPVERSGPAWADFEPPVHRSSSDVLVVATRPEHPGTVVVLEVTTGITSELPMDEEFRILLATAAGVVFTDPSWPTITKITASTIDLRLLALLSAPQQPYRGLKGLCADLGLQMDGDNRDSDARAAAACLKSLLDAVDPTEPSWPLAAACLLAAGSVLARFLPTMPLPATAHEGLTCAVDPLLDPPADQGTAANAQGHVHRTFSHLKDLDYVPRQSQKEMAEAVAEVLDHGGRLAVEAPTGTGKSLAYLAPAAGRAAQSRTPVVVATATKVLQQQLRHTVETLQKNHLFPAPFRQVFGVSNYICTRDLAAALEVADAEAGTEHWIALAVAVRALATSVTGVWDDVADSELMRHHPQYRLTRQTLRTDSHSCERQQCEWIASCPLFTRLDKFKERPGVVVTNHAMLATWATNVAQAQPSPGNLLGDGQIDLIFDEAHDLEDTLTSTWTESVSRIDLLAFAARIDGRAGLVRHLRQLNKSGVDLPEAAGLRALRVALLSDVQPLTDAADVYLHDFGGSNQVAVLRHALVQFRPEYRALSVAADALARRLKQVISELNAVGGAAAAAATTAPPGAIRLLRGVGVRCFGMTRRAEQFIELLLQLKDLRDEHLVVHQLSLTEPRTEARPTDVTREPIDWRYECIPIDVGPRFADTIVGPARSVTLTSATLTTGGTFDYLGSRLAIKVEPGEQRPGTFGGRLLKNPFDHSQQSAVILTSHLPIPIPTQEKQFVEELARDQVGFLSLTGGKALVLFAARHRMEAVAALVTQVEGGLDQFGVQILVQGQVGKGEITERFRAEPGTVIYGLRSFWQGFDAPGETLSYLMIEKPPYPHPDDAVVAARVRAIADRGGDPFMEYTVPKTAILFAQGFGRLIRSETDRGVALICDRRMQSPSAANNVLLSTLPGPQRHYASSRDDAWRFALKFVTGDEPDLTKALALAGNATDATLERLRLIAGEDPEPKLREAAWLLFGIDDLRDTQLTLMLAHLDGRDTFGVLPTGSGKSLCFQLPALLRPENRATVVVSPLVALIKDQLDDLRSSRGLSSVQGITGNTTKSVRDEILRDVAAGKVRLLYVSPERLVRDPWLRTALERQDLAGLVVDEAHCISAWGHDFRPEFRRVSAAVAHLTRAPRMALTATATEPVVEDIIRTLELKDPVTVRLPSDRPNLRMSVTLVRSERDRARELLRIATAMTGATGLVYASRRSTTEEVAALLRRAGFSARHYHAGMVPEQREAVQDDFFAGTTHIVVATKAFGMGVNKPDIEWVIHYDLPESLDAYVQEAGRAARIPALTGECALLYSESDISRRRGHLTDVGEAERLTQATEVLARFAGCRRRGDDVVFDGEEMATAVGIDVDQLNVILAWLERTGALEQRPDCSARGTIHVGFREPEERDERRRYRNLAVALKLRSQTGSRIDFDRVQDELDVDLDELERDLVAWSLDRLITFSSSARYHRVHVLSSRVDAVALYREVHQWREWERGQLDAMAAYARGTRCRRAGIVKYFGFPERSCRDTDQRCDSGPYPRILDTGCV